MRSAGSSPLSAIGQTPVVPLKRLVPAGSAEVWIKLEAGNPTGSYKDRMALSMIEGAERRGALTAGMTVVEFTGGSTGSSLAFVCAVKGYRFHVVSSDAFAKEKLATMRAFGAHLELLPSDGGRITPSRSARVRRGDRNGGVSGVASFLVSGLVSGLLSGFLTVAAPFAGGPFAAAAG